MLYSQACCCFLLTTLIVACQIIEPCFDRTYIADAYANRKDKGTHAALNQIQRYCACYKYILQCDIKSFIPSIDHQILLHTLFKKITDPRVQRVIKEIIESGEGVLDEQYQMVYFEGDDLLSVNRPRVLLHLGIQVQ